MNSAQLRPPQPVFKTLAVLIVPAVLFWTGPHVFRWFLTPLQSHYFREYVKASIPTFGHAPKDRILLVASGSELHAETKPMGNLGYRKWLQENVYAGLPLTQFFRRALIVIGLVWAALFAWGVELDRKRHLKFRSEARHIRGTKMATREEFDKQIKGDGIGWRTEESA